MSTSTRKGASNLTTRSQRVLDVMAPRIMQGFANAAVCLERENSKRRFPAAPHCRYVLCPWRWTRFQSIISNVSVRLCYLFARACAFAAVNRCAWDL